MWPFNHKTNGGKTPEENAWFRQRSIEDAAIATLREWRDVGQTFDYLGRSMCVVRHSHPGPYGLVRVPAITATYADDNGVLREHVFDSTQCAVMIQEQPNA